MAAGLLLCAATSLSGQISDTIEIRVVTVDVVVSDRDGRPVEGLEREDFVLLEDGVEVPLTNFAVLSHSPAATPTIGGAEPPADAVSATIVLYVDDTRLLAGQRERLLQELERVLDTAPKSSLRYLVLRFDGSLRVEAGPTGDIGAVRAALGGPARPTAAESSGVRSLVAYRRAAERIRQLYEDFESTGTGCPPCECGLDSMLGAWEGYADAATGRAEVSVAALETVVSSLAGVPGRKAVLYVSSGLERRPGASLVSFITDLCASPQLVLTYVADYYARYDISERLERLTALAAAGQTTLYPVSGEAVGGNAETRVGGDALPWLAERTGGRRLFEAGAAWTGVMEDLGSFYSLGFRPSHPADDREHTLEVRLREGRRGTALRYRRSYVDRPLEARLAERLMAAYRYGAQENPLEVAAAFGQERTRDDGRRIVPLELSVPLTRLALGGADVDSSLGNPTLQLLLVQGRPGETTGPIRQMTVQLPRGDQRHVFSLGLDLPEGENRVALGIRDPAGGEASWLVWTVAVAPPG